jgi:hypothetical protein
MPRLAGPAVPGGTDGPLTPRTARGCRLGRVEKRSAGVTARHRGGRRHHHGCDIEPRRAGPTGRRGTMDRRRHGSPHSLAAVLGNTLPRACAQTASGSRRGGFSVAAARRSTLRLAAMRRRMRLVLVFSTCCSSLAAARSNATNSSVPLTLQRRWWPWPLSVTSHVSGSAIRGLRSSTKCTSARSSPWTLRARRAIFPSTASRKACETSVFRELTVISTQTPPVRVRVATRVPPARLST